MATSRKTRGLTIVELLLSVSISSLVLYASFALVSAYGYASNEVQDLRPLRSEASTVQMYVLNWLRQSRAILNVTDPEDQLTVTINALGVREVGKVEILVYGGDSPARAYDSMIQIDELRILSWLLTLDFDSDTGEIQISGQLRQQYIDGQDPTLVTTAVYNGVPDGFRDSPDLVTEVIAENVYRFLVTEFGDPKSLDIDVSLMAFEQLMADESAPNGLFKPPTYSFQVVGGPDSYVDGQVE